jgi:gentisate 1,2-dioxygenase
MTRATAEAFGKVTSLDEIYRLLASLDIENGWAKREPSLYPLPKKSFAPAHWAYGPAQAALHAAGRYVNTELAERRNLILVNPIPGNTYPTVRTLVAAYQMVKAGEIARSHRHSANALRLVLDTEPGTFTVVDGKKVPMVPGDVLLTPNWSWHAHANESAADAYWMDVLDVPTVHLLNPMFFEHHEDGMEPVSGIASVSPFRFPFADTKTRLDAAPEIGPGCREVELEGPAGGPAMATISLRVMRLDPGARIAVEPTTASAIVAVIEGEGSSVIDDKKFDWGRGDALAVPSGAQHVIEARTLVHLLRASDEPILQALGWLRAVPKAAGS